MLKRLLPIVSVILWFLCPEFASATDGYKRNPDVDITHYCFCIYLNDSTDRIIGSAAITVKLAKKTKILELDLVGLKANGTGMVVDLIETGTHQLTWRHANNQIEIEVPDTLKTPGTFSLSVDYSGVPEDGLIISKNKFGERTFFGDNWPDRARNWLPCVDHPSDKATVEFIITAPIKYKVVSNGYLAGEYPETSATGTRLRVSHWKEDVPVPTKVMVIGAADFAWETSGFSKGIPVQSWVYAQNREAGFMDYKPAPGILTFYQDLVGTYSYEKLANVQSKTRFGGMENSGCIFYSERSVTGKNQLHNLLAHEIAHQWFGDAVTENDWHHVWISEGFATYLEACYADSMIPGNKLDATMADMRKSVIRYFDRTQKPLIDTTIVDNLDLLNTNSYQKGAWVLHMLRQELGDKVFWAGVRNFYAAYRDKNALSSDLQTVMEKVSGRSLNKFFNQWLEIPGQPFIEWSWTHNKKKKIIEIDLEQIQNQHTFIFKLPLEVCRASSENDTSKHCKPVYYLFQISEKKQTITFPVDFPVSEIRLDPRSQLLFREKMIIK